MFNHVGKDVFCCFDNKLTLIPGESAFVQNRFDDDDLTNVLQNGLRRRSELAKKVKHEETWLQKPRKVPVEQR
jgi:hypothetical protein